MNVFDSHFCRLIRDIEKHNVAPSFFHVELVRTDATNNRDLGLIDLSNGGKVAGRKQRRR